MSERDVAAGPVQPDASLRLDEHNPWLGLAAFTEQTREYFFGRDIEVSELSRRVQRKLLTVLFGKSGLGKTSMLRAGLVPRLRALGYFPVYLRIDYQQGSAEPAEQIKRAIERSAADGEAAVGGQPGALPLVAPEESIWEFLHRRDEGLQEAIGAAPTPLLIFDQFEELFTLAQSDEFGRARARRFVEELADLVENRAPKALEARLESDESLAQRFDFSRSDYRVVIALREDYLAPLESLKSQMPSLAQNRLRLAPMTGEQALEAVLRPGKRLVSEEVAEAIVRFVAGGAELANAEVEPSLLSLICRELNEQRIAQHRALITQDLLAGSHDTILSSFYERALADQPASVRQIIEDDLLTESGYRENLAEESLLRRFEGAGAASDALAKLVNRRLLRIEERLDVRRVELTHDVLTGVVKASRDQRHEREAREAAQRTLAEQRARETAARRALRRARAIATGCTLLAAIAITAAVLALISVQRARRAERVAGQVRAVSEQARRQAERLLGFLTDDFVAELESFGRYQTIVELSSREIDYFRALPTSLTDPQSIRNGALAYVNRAEAMLYLGKLSPGAADGAAAIALLESLRRGGDDSESTSIILARAYRVRGANVAALGNPEYRADFAHAVDLLRPPAIRADASAPIRRAYVGALADLGQAQWLDNHEAEALSATAEAMRVAEQLGVHHQLDMPLEADYADAGAWRVYALTDLGRYAEARRAGADALVIADQVLAERPQYGRVLFAKQTTEGALEEAASNELRPADALRFATQDQQTSSALVQLEPANSLYVNELGTAYSHVGDALWAQGRLRQAIASYRQALDADGRASTTGAGGAFYVVNLAGDMTDTGTDQAGLGDPAGAAATVAAADAFANKLHLSGYAAQVFNVARAYPQASVAYERGHYDAARDIARSALARWQAHPPEAAYQTLIMDLTICRIAAVEARADYALGDFVASAQAGRTALSACGPALGKGLRDRRREAAIVIWLSMALARQGEREEAARMIAPIVAMYRGLEKTNQGDQWVALEMAGALYAQALTDERQRAELLQQATLRLNHVSPVIAALPDAYRWRALVAAGVRATTRDTRAGRR